MGSWSKYYQSDGKEAMQVRPLNKKYKYLNPCDFEFKIHGVKSVIPASQIKDLIIYLLKVG